MNRKNIKANAMQKDNKTSVRCKILEDKCEGINRNNNRKNKNSYIETHDKVRNDGKVSFQYVFSWLNYCSNEEKYYIISSITAEVVETLLHKHFK